MHTIKSKTKQIFFILPVLLFLTGIVALGNIEDNIEKTFNVNAGGKLTIDTARGSVEIRGTNSNRVEVKLYREYRSDDKKRAREAMDNFIVSFKQSGDDVEIIAEYKNKSLGRLWNNIRNRLRIKYVVTVPGKYNVDLHTRGGSILVEDLEGRVITRTSGGSLEFNNIDGPIKGNTSGGSITIGETLGDVDVHTSGGSITIDNAQGDVEASTSGGGIKVNEVSGTIHAKTSGGSIKAYISRKPKSSCRLTTSGGSVTVYLNEGIGVHVDAHTSGGRVYTDFPVTIKGEIKKHDLNADINGGGPELYLRTSGGSIHIKKK